MRADPKSNPFGQEYFQQVYRCYDAQNPPYKLAFYRRLVSRWVRPAGQPKILDMGCAFGRFLGTMEAPWAGFGVDISEYAIGIAQKLVPQATFSAAPCTAIPFKGPFDAIVSFDVLEHVPDLAAVASFVGEALQPGGILVFVVPVYDGPLGWLVNLLDPDPTHIHKKGREFWLSWAAGHFQVVEWCGIFRYLLPYGPYVNWPTRWLRSMSPAIAVVARKPDSVGPQTHSSLSQ